MKFGIQLNALRVTRGQANLAEFFSLNSIWLPHHSYGRYATVDIFKELKKLITNTSEIEIGLGVTDVLRNSPETLREEFEKLRNLSNNRILLGLGAGEVRNLSNFNLESPVDKLENALKYFKKENFKVPIYIGGRKKRMRRLVRDYGEGWLPFCLTPKEYDTWKPRQKRYDHALLIPTGFRRDLNEFSYYRWIAHYWGTLLWAGGEREEYQKIFEESRKRKKIQEEIKETAIILDEVRKTKRLIDRFTKAGCEHLVCLPVKLNNIELIYHINRLRKKLI